MVDEPASVVKAFTDQDEPATWTLEEAAPGRTRAKVVQPGLGADSFGVFIGRGYYLERLARNCPRAIPAPLRAQSKSVGLAQCFFEESMKGREREVVLVCAGAGVMLVFLLIVQSFDGSGLLSARTVTSVSTSSVTFTSTMTIVLSTNQTREVTIVRSNITSAGRAGALVVCGTIGFPCPNQNQALPATLISYDGVLYYDSYVPTTYAIYTAWYTNSTVFCITPPIRSLPSCPIP